MKTEFIPSYISRLSLYCPVNKLLHHKADRLILSREIISFFCATHSKHINTSCEQNVGVLNVRSGCTHSNHWALEGLEKSPMERNHLADPCVREKKILTWS